MHFFNNIAFMFNVFKRRYSRCFLANSNSNRPSNNSQVWVNQLDKAPPIYVPNNVTDSSGKLIRQDYVVSVREFMQQILPVIDANGNPTGFGATKVWGFEGQAKDAVTGEDLGLIHSSPGGTFEANRGVPVQVKWVNNLVDSSGNPLMHMFAIDPTIQWANPNGMESPNPVSAPAFPSGYSQAQSPVPIVIHLHGERCHQLPMEILTLGGLQMACMEPLIAPI